MRTSNTRLGQWVDRHPDLTLAILKSLDQNGLSPLLSIPDFSKVAKEEEIRIKRRWRRHLDETLQPLHRTDSELAELITRHPGIALYLIEGKVINLVSLSSFSRLSVTERQELLKELSKFIQLLFRGLMRELAEGDDDLALYVRKYPLATQSIIKTSIETEYIRTKDNRGRKRKETKWWLFLLDDDFTEDDKTALYQRLHELVTRLRQHIPGREWPSLDDFVDAYQARIWRVIRGFNLSEEAAVDCFQEIFVLFFEDGYRRIRLWDPERSRYAFLKRMVSNAIINYLNRWNRGPEPLRPIEDLPIGIAEEGMDYDRIALINCMRKVIDTMIAQGDLSNRDTAVLRGKLEGRKSKELGPELEPPLSPGAVDTQYHRLKKRIRKRVIIDCSEWVDR
jgi:RNA polymerase sigma factor (sigma-70 family)